MSVVRTLFLGTPEIAKQCLQALQEDDHFEIVGVVSQPDRPAGRKMKLQASEVSAYAEQNGLRLFKPESAKDPEFLKSIEELGAECAVVVAYGQILTENFLNLYPKKVVNVHASLLPRWRGAAPIQRAIMEGDKETGVCLQVMVKKLDAGDVLNSRKIAIHDSMNALELHDAMIPLAQDLLTIDFMDYLRGNLSATPQNEDLITYAKKIEKSEASIDWTLSAQKISQNQRGLMMGPGSVTVWNSKKLKIIRLRVIDQNSVGSAGQVIAVSSDSFDVQCGQGVVRVEEVQPESRSRQSVEQFLRGHDLKKGDSLG